VIEMPDPAGRFDYRGMTPDILTMRVDRALMAADALADAAVAAAGDRDPTFAAVVGAIDRALVDLWDEQGRTAFLVTVHPDAAVRTAAQAGRERIERWRRDLPLRDDVARAVAGYAASPEAASLAGEERRLLDHWRRDLRRAGHDLPPARRREVRALAAREVELEAAFLRNIDEWQAGIDLPPAELAGMPASYLAGLRPGTTPGTLRVTLEAPDMWPLLEGSPRRELREALLRLWQSRAVAANRPILEELLDVRRRHARLLGYPSWAHYRIEPKMAATPERVEALHGSVVPGLRDLAAREYAAMAELLERDTGDTELQRWDWYYYRERIFAARRGADPGEVSAYLPLDAVLEGLLGLALEVFGVRCTELPEAAAWHDDIRLFEVTDAADGALLGWWYADLHPREGKSSGAVTWPLSMALRGRDGDRRPGIAALLVNVPRSTDRSPSCLRHDDVETLFHEFGHVLHCVLGTSGYQGLSMMGLEQDFTEAISQVMENWAWEPAILRRISRHRDTGERMPEALASAVAATRTVNIGSMYLRSFIAYSMFDLMVHGPAPQDLEQVMREVAAVEGLPLVEGAFWPAGFLHLAEVYDAGYYGYLWSRAYGDDFWSRFAREGMVSPIVGREYRVAILEPAGTRDAESLVEDFLGRPFSSRAFLERAGLAGPAPA
jgi:Zn-dependent oligopeptidase